MLSLPGSLKNFLPLIFLIPSLVQQKKDTDRKGEFYFSRRYNKEWYTLTDIKVNQPALGNQYPLHQAKSHDNAGWDKGISTIPSASHNSTINRKIFSIKKEAMHSQSIVTTLITSSKTDKPFKLREN